MRVNNSYAINGVILPLAKNMSDLGIMVDNNLEFKLHVSNTCVKAKQKASLILRCFYTHDKYILFIAFTTYVMSDLLMSSVVLFGHRINARLCTLIHVNAR